jgi:hypothetical protein
MNCSPTLTAHEFKDLHNALCELRSIKDMMYHSIVKVDRVESVIAQFELALAGAYQQDDSAFDTKHDHYSEVKKALGLDAVWSIYEVDNLSEAHPYGDVKTVTYENHWGPKPVVKGIAGTSWAALYTAANACIRDSGDEHHVFIEDFKVRGDTLVLSTGS